MASLHYRSGRVLTFGWTMMYKWGHPVSTLPSVGGDYTSLSLNDVNSANHGLNWQNFIPAPRRLTTPRKLSGDLTTLCHNPAVSSI
eukprot:6196744-Pleurochrysis_carterae.AAC.1